MQQVSNPFSRNFIGALLVIALSTANAAREEQANRKSAIVQGASVEQVQAAVARVGGRVTHELGIIKGAGVELTAAQRKELEAVKGLKVHSDDRVRTNGGPKPDAEHVRLIGADLLHEQGIDGSGITVAVVDTGMWYSHNDIKRNLNGDNRIVAEYDAIKDEEGHAKDQHGHGTHLTSIIASSQFSDNDKVHGIAPNVNLVNVKAFNRDGSSTYADVIRGLDWIVANHEEYDIRVVNLSFSSQPKSHYWEDPLNQAVMAAWEAGIVIVASAGNTGPDAMTIGVPGNVPYVITVGALTDSYTPGDPSDDRLASFSSAGPTYEGFVKPDVVAPGGHMLGIMDNGNHDIADRHPEWVQENDRLYVMSGTSQSAAVVTGAVALLLQAKPELSPDDVKCQLMASAQAARSASGDLAYSIFQQGAGMINAAAAVANNQLGCANTGLDVTADLTGDTHFGGRARQDVDGNYYIEGVDGYLWADGYLWSNGYLWADSEFSANGYLWADGYLWSNGYLWADGYLWSNGYLWANGLAETASVNTWVEQE